MTKNEALARAEAARHAAKVALARHSLFQAVDKTTGEVLAESNAPAPLEERFAEHGHCVFIRNAQTGAEWDIPE